MGNSGTVCHFLPSAQQVMNVALESVWVKSAGLLKMAGKHILRKFKKLWIYEFDYSAIKIVVSRIERNLTFKVICCVNENTTTLTLSRDPVTLLGHVDCKGKSIFVESLQSQFTESKSYEYIINLKGPVVRTYVPHMIVHKGQFYLNSLRGY